MKHKALIASLGILIILSCSITCLASEIVEVSLRGGISFNSTKKDIIDYENSQMSYYEINPTGKDFYTDNCILVSYISLAGYEDSNLLYYFNTDDSLSSVIYCFEENSNRDATDKQYEILNEALSKYGTPMATGEEFIDINPKAIDVLDIYTSDEHNSSSHEIYHVIDKNAELRAFSQRIVEQSNGYIDIKLIEFQRHTYMENHLGKAFGDNRVTYDNFDTYFVAISYTYCTQEQMQALIDKANEKMDAINNDL